MTKILVSLWLLLPSLAWAHSDHGNSWVSGLQHVLSSPEHSWPLLAGGAVLCCVGLFRSR